MRAGGDNAGLASDLKDYAAFSLRRAAEDADGTLDPVNAAKWLKGHEEALSVFPQLRTAFGDAVSARATMDGEWQRVMSPRGPLSRSPLPRTSSVMPTRWRGSGACCGPIMPPRRWGSWRGTHCRQSGRSRRAATGDDRLHVAGVAEQRAGRC